VTPERWQEIKAMLAAALERTPPERRSYLDQACPDAFVRGEVESLIAAHEEGDSSFMERPATENSEMLPSGSKLGPYEILTRLGAGGMGEVYRARDTRLDRTVAIKILPARLSSDPVRKQRLEREAKTISSLNHPHICVLYDIGNQDGIDYLVMECVEGETLAKRLQKGALPLEQVLKYGMQIADALDKAHRSGVVHRDLKPGNIMLTPTGAKLLDFGLAKATPSLVAGATLPAATRNSPMTEQGTIVGTFQYMSPEQIGGKELDGRSDIFSFGAVLYEMLTGERAFEGKGHLSVASAILEKEPVPISSIKPMTPPALDHTIRRCMSKDPDERWQTARDLQRELKWIADPRPQAGVQTSLVSQSKVRERLAWSVALAACVALLATAFVAYHFWPRSNVQVGPARITQISRWNKPMQNARLSPDGHNVAFVSPVGGVAQVFLMLTSGGELLQLTNDEGDKYVDTFSPDGTEIYYETSIDREEVWAVPTLGGAPRRVVSGGFAVPSPDGEFIYYVKSDGSGIFRAGKSGLNEEQVYNDEGSPLSFIPLLLFPGGNDVLAAGVRRDSPNILFSRINVTRHEAVDFGEVSGNPIPPDVVWAEPGKTLLLSRTVNGLTNIWKYSLQDRSLTQITFGAGPDFSPMPDPGGKGIYLVNGKSSNFLTAYHVHSKQSTDIVSEDATEPAISPDGKRVMYIIPAGENLELWVSDINGGNKLKIATGDETLTLGTWASDNIHLSFNELATGTESKNYIVGADGSGLRELPPMGGTPMNPVWSPDQKSLYVSVVDKGQLFNIWKWTVDSSSPEKVVDHCVAVQAADPGGQYLLGTIWGGEKAGILEVSISERRCISLLPGMITASVTFARDGKSFLYAVASRGEVTIFRQPWRDGKVVGAPQVALKVPFAFPLTYNGGRAYDISRDLSTIVYVRRGGHADLYLLSQK
jgi:serine/threonine protein kinase/Tol biopolymer transport system component